MNANNIEMLLSPNVSTFAALYDGGVTAHCIFCILCQYPTTRVTYTAQYDCHVCIGVSRYINILYDVMERVCYSSCSLCHSLKVSYIDKIQTIKIGTFA